MDFVKVMTAVLTLVLIVIFDIGIAYIIIRIGTRHVINEIKAEFFYAEQEAEYKKRLAREEWEEYKAQRDREAEWIKYKAEHQDDYERWRAERMKEQSKEN